MGRIPLDIPPPGPKPIAAGPIRSIDSAAAAVENAANQWAAAGTAACDTIHWARGELERLFGAIHAKMNE
jgi:hypothetical protein